MFYDLDLDSGEVAADRHDPADEAEATRPEVSAAALAEWEANPWF